MTKIKKVFRSVSGEYSVIEIPESALHLWEVGMTTEFPGIGWFIVVNIEVAN